MDAVPIVIVELIGFEDVRRVAIMKMMDVVWKKPFTDFSDYKTKLAFTVDIIAESDVVGTRQRGFADPHVMISCSETEDLKRVKLMLDKVVEKLRLPKLDIRFKPVQASMKLKI